MPRVVEGLRRGAYTSESAVAQQVVLPILTMLGWDTFDPQQVIPEFSVGNGRVDFALCHPPTKPAVFIEVKRAGSADGEQQLFRYAFDHGVALLILTNGQVWSFYLPTGQGTFEDRRLYQLDLLERHLADAEQVFDRYLRYVRVESGAALRDATDDSRERSQRSVSRQEIPHAWRELIAEADSDLCELIAERVERRCGVLADASDVEAFLQSLVPELSRTRPESTPTRPTRDEATAATQQLPPPLGRPTSWYKWGSHYYENKSAKSVFLELLNKLDRADPSFLERFAARSASLMRKRNLVSRKRADLYPDRADLSELFSAPLGDGWWVGTNYNRASLLKFCKAAAEVAGLAWGTELTVSMP